MKSFSDFKKVRETVKHQDVRDRYYREEIYKEGEWVLTEKDQVGKIIRRGVNYVICVTAEATKFRTWVKDIKEVFEIGTDAYRQYVMSLTPGQKVQKPEGTVKVKQIIPTDPKKDKMDNHESVDYVQSAVEALHKDLKREWRFDKSPGKLGNRDVKGVGAKGVGGGDAPGMKLAEPKGTEGAPKVKKPKHACATKVEHAEWGKGDCMTEMHTLDEEGKVTHYDVMFEHGLEKNVAVPTLNILDEAIHEHVINHDKNKEVVEHHEKDKDGKTIPHEVDEGFKGKKKKKVKESFKNWRLTEKK
jgi:hypothetical protein|tara:strand:+ start:1288 stop:2190 length:903 start_codon:yes stop_codon:yes gene_type:complete